MNSVSQQQTELVNRNRFKLLEIFCQYDLGNLSKDGLDQQLKELKIEPTQAYEAFMRKQCGSLKFNEFIQTLTISDDKVVDNMMNIPNTNKSVTEQHILESPHRSKAIGCFNTDLDRYSKKTDFLQWKRANRIHQNDAEIAQKENSHAINLARDRTSEDMQKILSPKSTKSKQTSDEKTMKRILKMYCQQIIDIDDLEKYIKESGMRMNASQQRIIAECRVNPDVKLSDLYLTFSDPKQTKFSAKEAVNAMREPLILIDHCEDILTWRGDTNDIAKINEPRSKKKSFVQAQGPSILKWREVKNEESKKPALGSTSKSFRSQIMFDGGLVPKDQARESTPVNRRPSAQFESTKHLLDWDCSKTQKEKSVSNEAKPLTTHEKYWADSRVPFQNSPLSMKGSQ